MIWSVHHKNFMSFGASQKEISFSLFSTWIKEINNNYLFHHKIWHILYFYNKLDITRNSTKLEQHHLDLPIKRYTFLNLYTNLGKRIKEHKFGNPNQLLGRPGKILRGLLRAPALPTARPREVAQPAYASGPLSAPARARPLIGGSRWSARETGEKKGDDGSSPPTVAPASPWVQACSPHPCAPRGTLNCYNLGA
jgi:hypothetical protein